MVPTEIIEQIAKEIEGVCYCKEEPASVEDIQDMVERKLMKGGFYSVAKSYITYRYTHAMARDKYNELMNAIDVKLRAKDVQNQNANVDEKSFGGRVGEASDVMMRRYALDYIISPKSRANHLNNEIYIHDLNAYAVGMHNCLSIPFDKLLANGFNTRQTDVRPAGSINTAMQLVAVIFQLQSLQQFGGVSATHLDWTLVPYVRKSFLKHFKDGVKYLENDENFVCKYNSKTVVDVSVDDTYWKQWPKAYDYAIDMTEKETYQATEALYHNLNTLTQYRAA